MDVNNLPRVVIQPILDKSQTCNLLIASPTHNPLCHHTTTGQKNSNQNIAYRHPTNGNIIFTHICKNTLSATIKPRNTVMCICKLESC